jgi:hypothetical protein
MLILCLSYFITTEKKFQIPIHDQAVTKQEGPNFFVMLEWGCFFAEGSRKNNTILSASHITSPLLILSGL